MYLLQRWPVQQRDTPQNLLRRARASGSKWNTSVSPAFSTRALSTPTLFRAQANGHQLRSRDVNSSEVNTTVGVAVGVSLSVFILIAWAFFYRYRYLRTIQIQQRRRSRSQRRRERRRSMHQRHGLPTTLLNGQRHVDTSRVEGRPGENGLRGGAGLPGRKGGPGQAGLPSREGGHAAPHNQGLGGFGGGGQGGSGRVEVEGSDDGGGLNALGGSGVGGEGRGGDGGDGGHGGRGGDGGIGGNGGTGSAHAQAQASVYSLLMCCVLAPRLGSKGRRRPGGVHVSGLASESSGSFLSYEHGIAPIVLPAPGPHEMDMQMPHGIPAPPPPVVVIGKGGKGLGGVGHGGEGGHGGLGGHGGEGGQGGEGGIGEATAEAVVPIYPLFMCCIFPQSDFPGHLSDHRHHRGPRDHQNPGSRIKRQKY
ncbi:hypothetical protein F5Y19DRAFT_491516 [Xylariaceae sp. FL1651]|nr:hypothetical protein F5Y19DRAFT_491516 [Xylariaceae sp. FL1651]